MAKAGGFARQLAKYDLPRHCLGRALAIPWLAVYGVGLAVQRAEKGR